MCVSHQSSAAGSAAHRGGHRADGADGGGAGAMGQRGHAHGHALTLLGLGWAGGGKAYTDNLVDGREKAKLQRALEIPGGVDNERQCHVKARTSPCPCLLFFVLEVQGLGGGKY